MASNKPDTASNSVPSNAQIKVELGTSPVLKTERSLPTTTRRLTSFRMPRDLTLGGSIKIEKAKKIYTPNLNVPRMKKREDTIQNDSIDSAKGRSHNRRYNKDKADKGHAKGSNNLIQSTGVWSTGIEKTSEKRYSNGSKDIDQSSQIHLEKPKLDLNLRANKAEEEKKLKLLLRDDFIDDEEPMNLSNYPVMLPIAKVAKLYKNEDRIKIENKEEEAETVKKLLFLKSKRPVLPKEEPKIKVAQSDIKSKEDDSVDISKIVENKANSYVLMEFPDCLPSIVDSEEDARPSCSNTTNYEKDKEAKPQTKFCMLNSLKPGLLGKLQILKSGKARLVLGEHNLVVEVGSHVSFRQDLIAAKMDTETLNGDLINLGPVSDTLLCTPDWESMLVKL